MLRAKPLPKSGSRGRRGSAMLEFVLAAIPIIFLTTSIFEISLESWRFHSMAYAVDSACRYAVGHGRTCTKGTNACTIKVKDVAAVLSNLAMGLDPTQLNVTLKSANATINCNPLSNCTTAHCPSGATCTNNATQFPSSTDNGVGSDITISATYPMPNPLPMLGFGSGSSGSSLTLGATSRQTIGY